MRVTTLLIFASLASFVGSAAAQPAPPEVFEAKYCSGCHAVDKKMVGPSMKDVAKKYRDQKDAATYLAEKIKKGGTGVWGSVPMPPADVTEAEIKSLVEWIVKL